MEEQIVSFETAKLAKEKGFDIYTGKAWIKKEKQELFFTPAYTGGIDYHAPTQSLLQKWLREVHNVQLTIIPVGDVDFSLKYWHYSILGLNCNEGKNDVNRFFTYEQTLEEGLKEALKLV